MDFHSLPNFFIIGAAKSGTTSLFDIIAHHPKVYVAKNKETRFFSNDDRFQKGIDWYLESFFPGSKGFAVRCEATPAYLTWSDKVAPRIKSVYGKQPVKFAAIFRDPVKRAYSHYWHRVRQGDEDPSRISFRDAIHTESKRINDIRQWLEYEGNGLFGYFRAGCYASRLAPYLELFPRENIFFMLQEDLYNDFQSIMAKLLCFLEINDEVKFEPVVSNRSAVPRNQSIYQLFVKLKKSGYRDFLKMFIPSNVRHWLRYNVLMQRFQYPPMDNDIKVELYSSYADEIKQLEKIIGRDLSHWK